MRKPSASTWSSCQVGLPIECITISCGASQSNARVASSGTRFEVEGAPGALFLPGRLLRRLGRHLAGELHRPLHQRRHGLRPRPPVGGDEDIARHRAPGHGLEAAAVRRDGGRTNRSSPNRPANMFPFTNPARLPNIGFIVIAGPDGTSWANACLASSLGFGIFIELSGMPVLSSPARAVSNA